VRRTGVGRGVGGTLQINNIIIIIITNINKTTTIQPTYGVGFGVGRAVAGGGVGRGVGIGVGGAAVQLDEKFAKFSTFFQKTQTYNSNEILLSLLMITMKK
jgi:hypothetical protein